MLKKRGVSEVVSIVLIIMITVAAVAILWTLIIPLVKDSLSNNQVCSTLDLSIEVNSGYTCQDNEIKEASVQVKKGAQDVNITALTFYLLSEGNSVTYYKKVSLEKNSITTIPLDISLLSNVEEISVAPTVRIGNTEKLCKVRVVDKISSCKLIPNKEALAPLMNTLPNFKVGEKYDTYLTDSACSPGGNNCDWKVIKVEQKIFDSIWVERKDPDPNYNRPMLPLGISFEEINNMAHFYHPYSANPIPASKLGEDKPTNFKITVEITKTGSKPKTRELNVDLVA